MIKKLLLKKYVIIIVYRRNSLQSKIYFIKSSSLIISYIEFKSDDDINSISEHIETKSVSENDSIKIVVKQKSIVSLFL